MIGEELLARHDEIAALLDSVPDPRLKAFLELGITTVITGRGLAASQPSAPFDLVFFAEVLRSMFEREEVLASILAGDLDRFTWPVS